MTGPRRLIPLRFAGLWKRKAFDIAPRRQRALGIGLGPPSPSSGSARLVCARIECWMGNLLADSVWLFATLSEPGGRRRRDRLPCRTSIAYKAGWSPSHRFVDVAPTIAAAPFDDLVPGISGYAQVAAAILLNI